MPGSGLDGWLTMEEAAARFDVERDTLRRAVYDGRLPATKIGSAKTHPYLLRPADVERYVNERSRRRKPKRADQQSEAQVQQLVQQSRQ